MSVIIVSVGGNMYADESDIFLAELKDGSTAHTICGIELIFQQIASPAETSCRYLQSFDLKLWLILKSIRGLAYSSEPKHHYFIILILNFTNLLHEFIAEA